MTKYIIVFNVQTHTTYDVLKKKKINKITVVFLRIYQFRGHRSKKNMVMCSGLQLNTRRDFNQNRYVGVFWSYLGAFFDNQLEIWGVAVMRIRKQNNQFSQSRQ